MVRTIDQIFQELLLEKQTFTALDALVAGGVTDEASLITALNNGTAADWVLMLYNTAVGIHLSDLGIQSSVDEINTLLEIKQLPNREWYLTKIKEFQYGDTLTVNPTTYQPSYSVIDESKRIIRSVTLTEVANLITFKVRRTTSNILSAAELVAFTNYVNAFKSLGTRVAIVNYAPDVVSVDMEVIYDGRYDLGTVQNAVRSAIVDYLANVEFDSKLITNKMVDKIQAVKGVIDPRVNTMTATDANGLVTEFRFEYETLAGYASFDLDASTITFTKG